MKKHVYWVCAVMNIIAIICFTVLAVVFGKWWISLFSILFLTRPSEGHRVVCDGCGRYSPKGKDNAESIELARAAGWIRRKAGDKWEDYCPECRVKMGEVPGRGLPGMRCLVEALEAQVEELKKTFQGEGYDPCDICKHGQVLSPCDESDYDCASCNHDCACKDCQDYDRWEWRGGDVK